MRIQNNIAALNSHRQLGGNNNRVSKNLEKLSSGFKINRAGDDAAGLAISEKMRAQIKGLETASKNANDGISLIQTAEGALTEVHSMLNRMVELSTQSSNGTYGTAERQKLNDEVTQLRDEIDRISQGTNFNGINLLDGSLGSGGASGTGGATNTDGMALVAGAGALSDVAGVKGEYSYKVQIADKAMADNGGMKFKFKLTDGSEVDIEVKLTKDMTAASVNTAIKDAIEGNDQLKGKFDITVNNTTGEIKFNALNEGAGTLGIKEVTQTFHAVTAGTGELGANLAQIGMDVVFGTGTTIAVDDDPKAAMIDVVGKDSYKRIGFAGANGTLMGNSVTIGDKTYEFTSADKLYDVKEGNTGIVLGKDKAETMKNLVAALKKDGVTSAEVDNDGIKIGNTDQIKSTKGYGMGTDSVSGVKLGGNTDIDGVFTVATEGSGGAAAGQTAITINYKDKDGKDQSSILTLDLTTANTKQLVDQAIADAINGDKVLKDLFNAKEDGGTLTITAKNNKDGASITSMAADKANIIDVAAGTVTNSTNTVRAFGAGQTVDLDYGGIKGGDTLTVNGKTFEFVNSTDDLKNVKEGNIAVLKGANKADATNNLAAALKTAGMQAKVNDDGKVLIEYDGASVSGSNGLKLQVGDTNEDFQKVTVNINSMSAKSLGLDKVDIFDQDKAGDSMQIIKSAIEKVSTARGNLGALQNRLDHTINNLGVTTENMTAAESRIRDVDMAKEMMDFTKNNILTQAAQSMLAQANQLPQGVLQLLQ